MATGELYRLNRNLVPAEVDAIELIDDFDHLDDEAIIALLADTANLVKGGGTVDQRIESIRATADEIEVDQVRVKLIEAIEQIRDYIKDMRLIEQENADNPFFIALRSKFT